MTKDLMEIQQWNKQDRIFDGYLDYTYKDFDYCTVYYIADKGFAVLNRQPQYRFYQKLNIPEIQDVYVIPEARRQGVATALIHYCENVAMDEGAELVGISVGVSSDFGAAQRLYSKLEYHPDGNGVTYERELVEVNTMARMTPALCLMLVKYLDNESG